MKTTIAILILALASVLGSPAQAGGWGHCGHGGGGFSIGFGLPLFYGGYGYGGYGYGGYGGYYAPSYYAPSYGYYSRPYYYSAPYRSYGYGHGYSSSVGANVQNELARLGYYHGAIDGIIGPVSRDAIRRYQDSHRLPITGAIDSPLLRSLHL